jgi:hypothetical protein
VDKNIWRAIFWGDEPVTLFRAKPLDHTPNTLRHCCKTPENTSLYEQARVTAKPVVFSADI